MTLPTLVLEGLPSILAGFALGSLFFGGLWLTLRRAPRSRHPGRVLALSFVLRTAAVLGGFLLLMDGTAGPAAFGLVGFVMARVVLTRLAAPPVTATGNG